MIEILDEAGEELKRADHLIYVSLKYTRTADVLINTLSRLIDAYERLLDVLLAYAKDTKKLQETPTTPIEKGNLVKKLYPQQEVQDNVDLFFLMRKIYRAPYTADQEYRRHVSITTTIDNREEEVNIDIITQYNEFEKQFFHYVVDLIGDYAKKKFDDENGWEY